MTFIKKQCKKGVVFIFACLLLNNVLAGSAETALNVVKNSVTTVLVELNKKKSLYQNNPVALSAFIDKKILPHFDERAMAVKVLGQNWRQATKQQQKDFINEFKQLVLRTYSSNLLEYTNARVEYGKTELSHNDRIATVAVTVVANSGKSYPLVLTLLDKRKNSHWKVIDVSMEGLSIITVYQSALAEEIAKKGLQGIIDEYKRMNATGSTLKK